MRHITLLLHLEVGLGLLVFNAAFNNISAISWLLVVLVEEIGVPRGNHDLLQSLTSFIA